METFVVGIKDKRKSKFVKELLSSFDYLTIKKAKEYTAEEKKLLRELKSAAKEIDDHLKGKKRMKSAIEYLNELK